MLEFDWSQFIARDDNARPELGGWPQLRGEITRQANASVRGRITGQHTLVQRHARPGEALHVRHWSIAVEIGPVMAVLLEDAEHTQWGRMTGGAGGDRALRHPL